MRCRLGGATYTTPDCKGSPLFGCLTGSGVNLCRISGSMLGLSGLRCSTTHIAAEKSWGRASNSFFSASTPPADAPITITQLAGEEFCRGVIAPRWWLCHSRANQAYPSNSGVKGRISFALVCKQFARKKLFPLLWKSRAVALTGKHRSGSLYLRRYTQHSYTCRCRMICNSQCFDHFAGYRDLPVSSKNFSRRYFEWQR